MTIETLVAEIEALQEEFARLESLLKHKRAQLLHMMEDLGLDRFPAPSGREAVIVRRTTREVDPGKLPAKVLNRLYKAGALRVSTQKVPSDLWEEIPEEAITRKVSSYVSFVERKPQPEHADAS